MGLLLVKFSIDPFKMFSGLAVQLYGFTPHCVWTKNDEQNSKGEGLPIRLGSFSKCLTGAIKCLSTAEDKKNPQNLHQKIVQINLVA